LRPRCDPDPVYRWIPEMLDTPENVPNPRKEIVRIVVDKDLCSGHGRCAAVAPTVYSLDEAGFAAIDEAEVAPGDEEAARRGANNCPERAITVLD
jgi:ferredoxin